MKTYIRKTTLCILISIIFSLEVFSQNCSVSTTTNLSCTDHSQRNFCNHPADGTLTFTGRKNLYKDQSGNVWTLLSIGESIFHYDPFDATNVNVKLVRMSPNGFSSFETVRPLLQGENRTGSNLAGTNVTQGSYQQTYNFFDHRYSGFLHYLYDIETHYIFGFQGCNYLPYPNQQPGIPNSRDSALLADLSNEPGDISFSMEIINSHDPNEINGAIGFSSQNWITIDQMLPYTIRFENDSIIASAAAQQVYITLPIDNEIDISTIKFGLFGFGQFKFEIPADSILSFTEVKNARALLSLDVKVNFMVDTMSRILSCSFISLDTITGLPTTNASLGFLPVNDPNHNGEGFITFIASPIQTAHTGDVINEKAEIKFDNNASIFTNTWINTIDAGDPTSSVHASEKVINSLIIPLEINCNDDFGGSGIQEYNLYASKENDDFLLYGKFNVNDTVLYTGENNTKYRFFTRAIDNVGNNETLVNFANSAIQSSIELANGYQVNIYPNPTNGNMTIEIFYIEDFKAEIEIIVYDNNGKRLLNRPVENKGGLLTEKLNLQNFPKGAYLVEVLINKQSIVKKVINLE